jgi:hypothetical protein
MPIALVRVADAREAIDKHVAGHGTTSDGYLVQGRAPKWRY